MFPQRNDRILRFKIPTGGFKRGFGHAISTHCAHQFEYLSCALDLLTEKHWAEKFSQGRPRCFCPFFAVKRPLAARAFAPAFGAVRVRYAREDDAAFSSATETGFEKVDERQAN